MVTAKEIREYILSTTSMQELKAFNQLIKIRWNQIQEMEAAAFMPGDKVKWTSARYAEEKHGVVTKSNRRTVNVKETDGTINWKIPASMLTKEI